MKILIIGGTKFLGRHLIQSALAKNHEVTLFNRGTKYSDEPVESVEEVHGDRHSDLDNLDDRRWDAVIDTCGYLPQTVEISADFLKDKVDQYVFISSGSVYSDVSRPNYDESTATARLDPEQQKAVEKIDPKSELTGPVLGEYYGALKVLCEQTIERIMPNRTLNVRAGMIVGAFDWTDRFTYWVMRIAKGGEVLAPHSPEIPVQLVDARDLSAWIIKMIETNHNGIFNVTSPPFEINFGKMLEAMKSAAQSDAQLIWADEKFLAENKVMPWSEMPFYLPPSNEEARHFLTMNVDRAVAEGLEFRPLPDTVLEVLNWRQKQNFAMKAGISTEREAELIRKWKSL